jgi:hypothetical protein
VTGKKAPPRPEDCPGCARCSPDREADEWWIYQGTKKKLIALEKGVACPQGAELVCVSYVRNRAQALTEAQKLTSQIQ